MTTPSSTEPRISQATARARIVVIEGDSVLTELIRELLVDEGFVVSVCKRWEYAHACVSVFQPDLVLLDLRSGDEEYGWRILDQLTLDPATRSIPVIVSSGSVDSLLDGLLGTVDKALAGSPRSI